MKTQRRQAMGYLGTVAAVGLLASARPVQATAAESGYSMQGADSLKQLVARLNEAPRRRNFTSLPQDLTARSQWDDEALGEIIAYRGGDRQIWDNGSYRSGWLRRMNNSLNAQVHALGHPNFLIVSATHGSAQLALLDDSTWEKYEVARFTGSDITSVELAYELERLLGREKARNWLAGHRAKDLANWQTSTDQSGDTIASLTKKGVVFLACHYALWEFAEDLLDAGCNPDKLNREELTADLTNHVLREAIVTPGVAGLLPEFQAKGFYYAT
ncbi:transcriptional initiation protein Tat [Paraburkholderia sp.]|uniref:transcriptional initiation protein Tat n=1 Tax=Paraburkholderia sp. TaxID=1926495 RepID=UPI0039E232D0